MKLSPSALPAAVVRAHEGWSTELVYDPYMYATWRLTSPDGAVRFAKTSFSGVYPSLEEERARIVWAEPHIPVPHVVDFGTDEGVDWLLMDALPGVDASKCKEDQEAIVRALGEGLRRFHEVGPVDACPFDFSLDPALAHCKARIDAGVEEWEGLHDDFKPEHTPQTALEELFATRPSSEDLVVCHGDYCFPNMLIEDGVVTGYIDLGELGVADRWWDIAVGAWSVTWNVDPKWEPVFYEAYGVEPDPARIRFYRLMYDLAS